MASSKKPAAERRILSRSDWERSLAEVRVSKEDLNRLILDYLIIEGYRDAAAHFSSETGLSPPIDLASIEARMQVRSCLQRGEVSEALERVNELDPEILDHNPRLYFRLQQQRLIELIRSGDINEALSFAASELAPRGEENPELLEELERTMSLLAFDANAPPGSTSAAPPNLAALLSPGQRLKTAHETNAAILTAQGQSKEPKLPTLLRMLAWGEAMLEERAEFPRIDMTVLTNPGRAAAVAAAAAAAAAAGPEVKREEGMEL